MTQTQRRPAPAPTGSSAETDPLFAEAHHRIANNLSLIVGLVRLHAGELARAPGTLTAEEVKGALDDVAVRIETVAELHRLLSEAPGAEDAELGPCLGRICERLVSSLAGGSALRAELGPGCTVRPEQTAPLALIVSELVTNALKYAHPAGVGGTIRVACRRKPNGVVIVEVADDGVGLPEGFDPAEDGGLGLRVVHALAEQIGARPLFDSSPLGLHVRLLVPTAD